MLTYDCFDNVKYLQVDGGILSPPPPLKLSIQMLGGKESLAALVFVRQGF
jgi:hypothetical protein